LKETLPAGRLDGVGVVLTRPEKHAASVEKALRAAGGNPMVFPALEIVPIEESRVLDDAVDRLSEFDFAIFVSQNAVEYGLARATARSGFPEGLTAAAVGAATGAALRAAGIERVIQPVTGADSEALLSLPAFENTAGKRVVIFRGVGGREALCETLRRRGARVEYAECYVRRRPQNDATELLSAWRHGEVHAISVMSRETLDNFRTMIGEEGAALLLTTPLFVPHVAVRTAARALGCVDLTVTEIGDQGLIAALERRFHKLAAY
jgi:uroporphyrinogen-III synthase